MDVGAAHQADEDRPLHLVVGENFGQKSGDQLLHQHKALAVAGEGNQPAEHPLAAGDDAHALAAALGAQDGHGVNGLVAQEGEGLLAADDLGGEQGQDVGGKILLQKGLLLVGQAPEGAQLHPLARQLGHEGAADPVPLGQQGAGPVQNGGGLLGAGEARLVVHGGEVEGVHKHPHPDHIKLVQIALENRGEIQALAQGIGGVLGLLQHAAVELEPGQLPVYITAGSGGRVLVFHRRSGLLRRFTALL